MPKLNIYQQQYKASTPRATGESFGAAEGRANEALGRQVEKTGDVLTDLAVRSQNRLDGINTARAYQQYRATMDQELLTAQQAEDFSDPKVLQAFTTRAQELASETISGFEGSMDARAKLTGMLEQERGGYARSAYDTHVKEGYRVVGEFAQSSVTTIANRAKGSPEMLSSHLAEWGEEFEVLRDALPPEMEGQFYDAGVSQITQSVFGSYMDTGHFEEALATLEQPGVRDALGGDTYNKLRMDARSVQYDATKEARAIETKMALYTKFTGMKPSTAQVAEAFGMTLEAPEKTPGQKIREISTLLNITPESNPAMYNRVVEGVYDLDLGLGGGETKYGKAQGSLAYTDMSEIFGRADSGPVDDKAKRSFLESAHLYSEGTVDPETNEVKVKPLPPHFERMRQQFAADLGIDAGGPVPGAADPSKLSNSVVPYSGPDDPRAVALNASQDPMPDMTVMDVMPKLTGPRAVLSAMGESFVFTEDAFNANQEVEYQQWLQGVQKSLVNALRTSDKVLATEMELLNEEFNILGSVTKGSSGFASQIAGVDRTISDKIKMMESFVNDETQSPRAKEEYERLLPILRGTKRKLGVTRVDTYDQLGKYYQNGLIKDGSVIFDSEGVPLMFSTDMLLEEDRNAGN